MAGGAKSTFMWRTNVESLSTFLSIGGNNLKEKVDTDSTFCAPHRSRHCHAHRVRYPFSTSVGDTLEEVTVIQRSFDHLHVIRVFWAHMADVPSIDLICVYLS
jgi:hypothetical protein